MIFRPITPQDLPTLFNLRTRTRENRLTHEDLQALGITPESVTGKLHGTLRGWLCEEGKKVLGFSMSDGATGELWVVAVLPEAEGRGIGAGLMDLAEGWLWANRCPQAWLTTDLDPTLRAYGFYLKRGWEDWKLERGLRFLRLSPRNPTQVSYLE